VNPDVWLPLAAAQRPSMDASVPRGLLALPGFLAYSSRAAQPQPVALAGHGDDDGDGPGAAGVPDPPG
jgi:hypothetical protein